MFCGEMYFKKGISVSFGQFLKVYTDFEKFSG